MRNLNHLFSVLTLAMLISIGVQAQEETAMESDDMYELSIKGKLTWSSKYIWRGQERNDESVLQPSATLGYGNFGFNWWGNFDLTDGGREDNFSEYQWTVFYRDTVDRLWWEAGLIQYYFPGTGDGEDNDTREAYVSVGYDTILNPYAAIYYDFEEAHGFYGLVGVEHNKVLDDEERLTLTLGASIAYASGDYNHEYFKADSTGNGINDLDANDDGFNDLLLKAVLSYAITEHLSTSWGVYYSELLDSDVEDAADVRYSDSDNFWFAWTVGYTF